MRNYLKTLRKNNGFTQSEIAQRLGVTQPFYSQIEGGQRMPVIDLLLLINIADIYHVPVTQLIDEELKVIKGA